MDPVPPSAVEAPLPPPLLPESFYRRLPYARLAIVALAAVLRLWHLDLRPPHFDEGVNGWFLDQMQKIGYYKYDPSNYHGPLHFYVLFVFKCLFGRNLWALRLPVAIIGTLTVDWFFRFERFFGLRACAWAALAMAVSPGFLYYQRDAIHETWLVFFLVVACWGLFGLWQEGRRRYLWAAGMGLTGMILTKETYIIHVGCLLAAVPCALILERLLPSLRTPITMRPLLLAEPVEGKSTLFPGSATTTVSFDVHCAPQQWRWQDLAAVMAVGIAAILFFYSSNGFNPAGIKGLVTAYTPWGKKANEGEGHNKPFLYWLRLIWNNEPWVFLGLLASVRYALFPLVPDWRARLLAIYALGNMVAYSLIPYKTPWCVLAWAWPFFLVAGLGMSEFPSWAERRRPPWVGGTLLALSGGTVILVLGEAYLHRLHDDVPASLRGLATIFEYLPIWMLGTVTAAFLVAGAAELTGWDRSRFHAPLKWTAWAGGAALLGYSAYMAVDLNFFRPTDESESYVYVQTFNDINEITGPLYDLAKENPDNYHLRGMIVCDSTYPLPWLLGDFTRIGYYSRGVKPPDYHADFLLVTEARVAEAERGLDTDYFKQTLRLRAALEPQTLYLKASVFKHLMPEREPEFHPGAPTPPAESEPAAEKLQVP